MTTISRREFLQTAGAGIAGLQTCVSVNSSVAKTSRQRPNILFAIADDQSWPHTGAYGDRMVRTPAFDWVAEHGCLFTNAFCAAPQCSPNRASILTGRPIWQNREAGTHSSYFPNDLTVYPALLEQAGYVVGYTAKAWGPGNWEDAGWKHNPVGHPWNNHKLTPPAQGVNSIDYAGNFKEFYRSKPDGQPFCFWYGCSEPHRVYEKGYGLRSGKKLDAAVVPPFLPDVPEVRGDLLDYSMEIDWFDHHLNRMIEWLREVGELENTFIIVTSDNGMPFPRAKANLYEYGVHVPLAVCWTGEIAESRSIDDLVSFIDFAPTLLDAAGVDIPASMTGKSMMDLLSSGKSGIIDPNRNWITSGRERHSHARYDNLGYPSRMIRTHEFLYIRNLKPERWPAGDPPVEGIEGFQDVDASPSKSLLMQQRDKYQTYYDLAFAKRPLEELYRIQDDAACVNNLANDETLRSVKEDLWSRLRKTLTGQGDPRLVGNGDIFDSYPRFGAMRPQLGGFAERGVYNPKYQ